ncbi:bis(5'-nucleosyl)-tetraphosphatase (symmetrical) YqeK [uncultured Secundilactobacillus sp.]|uniref:bis(5'-nucleosyl)-tetraphosphatase (symmetrical) YqeK n=1 Tax=uncultured Secundilactobacillus sp. TaxID=2813935 RepID=UPI002588C206|nr:bis(5'-nucleosyl)-tetraphosphatase (symmetrical) YqeK [uncultured Secundilactobacillus sp.]
MTNTVVYSTRYFDGSREDLLTKLRQQLNDSRFEHVKRVEQTALQYADCYGVDRERASIAGLVHDYAKQRPDADFLKAISDYKLDPDLKNWGNAIWHGVVGAELIATELGITDQLILDAVRFHTTGNRYMTPLAQLIYMADYIEPARDFDGVQQARTLMTNNLHAAVAFQTKHTLAYLIADNKPVYPKTIDTYNAWVPGQDAKESLNG